jgi:hypothetical protein
MHMAEFSDGELIADKQEAGRAMFYVVFHPSASVGNNQASLRSKLDSTDVLPRRAQGQLGTRSLSFKRPDKVDKDRGQPAVRRTEGSELHCVPRQSEFVLGQTSGLSIQDLVGTGCETPQPPACITGTYLNLQTTATNPKRNELKSDGRFRPSCEFSPTTDRKIGFGYNRHNSVSQLAAWAFHAQKTYRRSDEELEGAFSIGARFRALQFGGNTAEKRV